MTEEIRDNIMSQLAEDFSTDQLREIDLAVAKALQGYSITREETLPVPSSPFPIEVREFIARKKMKGCSKGTIRQYELALGKFVGWARKDLKDMTDLDILIYLDYVQSRYDISNRSLENIRKILSTFYTFMQNTGKIQKNPARSVDTIKYRAKVRQPLSDMELERVRNSCETLRDKALVEVLYSTGARVSEIAALDRNGIDYVNRRAVITGKGNKQRYIFFSAKAIFAIQNYLSSREDDSEALFVRDRAPYSRLTASGIEYIIKRIGKRAGLKLYPHLFRHTFATDMLASGVPINEVAKMLGHEKIETTEIYAKASVEALASEHRKHIA